jgi:hypothetical protein
MLYFLIMIVETHWHDMQWTPWSRLCCHKNVGKNFLIWTSFEKYKQLWSYDFTNQIIKLIRTMNNSRTHPNLGADRWGPQLCRMGKSLAGLGRQFGATILPTGGTRNSIHKWGHQSQISIKDWIVGQEVAGSTRHWPLLIAPPLRCPTPPIARTVGEYYSK